MFYFSINYFKLSPFPIPNFPFPLGFSLFYTFYTSQHASEHAY